MSSSALPHIDYGSPIVDLTNNFLDSPPPGLSPSNNVPLNSEKIEAQWRRSRLDNDSSDLQCQPEGLDHYEESLQAIISPFQRLPTEILSEIFLCCVTTPRMLASSEPPWLLGMVCGRWRAVAMSTPRLWSSLYIDLDHISVDSMPITMFLVQTYLQRSGQSPLFLIIVGIPKVDCFPVLDVLASHSARWQDIMLSLTTPLLQRLDSASSHLPLLQKLEIEAPGYYVPPLNMFKAAPQLRDATVVLCHDVLYSLVLPWSQLTRYHGEFWGCKGALELLRQTPNILQCRLDLKERILSSGPGQPLRHSQLRRLDLIVDIDAPCCELLDCLTLPALDDIRIEAFIDNYLVDSLTSLLSRSSCSLTRLAICVIFSDVDYIRLLQETPLLIEFEFGGYLSTLSTLFTVLTEPSHERGETWRLVPRLRSIIFRCATECHHPLLIDMIESRFRGHCSAGDSEMDPVSRLQSVRLVNCRLDPDAQIRLQQLQLQGLNTSD